MLGTMAEEDLVSHTVCPQFPWSLGQIIQGKVPRKLWNKLQAPKLQASKLQAVEASSFKLQQLEAKKYSVSYHRL